MSTAKKAHKSAGQIVGGGEMGELIRSYDWTKTALGPIDSWSQSLVAAVNILIQTPVPVVMLWDTDGYMIYNDAYAVFAGGRHPKLLGSKVVEGWPEVADFNRNVMKQGLAGKTLSYTDQQLTLHRHGSPEEVWMDLHYSPVIDDSGKPAGVWAIVTETTQRVLAEQRQKAAEDALKSEQLRLRAMFVQAPALIAVLHGPDHVLEMTNQLYLDTITGGREVVGQTILEAIPELEGQGIIEVLDTVRKTQKPYIGELTAKIDPQKSGTPQEAYFNLIYQPISSTPNGPLDSIFVHAVDITDQVVSRQKAEQLNAQLEAIIDSMPDGLYIADKTRITHINQRGAEVLGYKDPSEVPRNLVQLYDQLAVRYVDSDKQVTVDNSTIGQALKGKSVQHNGVRVTNPISKKEQILRTSGSPIRDKSGNIIGGVAVNYDMTDVYKLMDKVQAETVKRKLFAQKAKLLKSQNDQLQSINTMKDEFIGLTSHQLRTPATSVKQYIAMLMQGYAGEVTKPQLEFLERAYNSNERQLRITDSILRVAQVDMGKLQLHTQEYDLVELVTSVLDDQAELFTQRSLTLQQDLPTESVYALIDPNQLRMAIDNIVDNAIKYTDDGKRVSIRLTKHDSHTARLEICDEGVGISQDDLVKLYQKFSRIDNPRSIAVGGSGLGLYWSKKIIELHHGHISATSELKKGTTFVVELPIL